MNQPIKLDTLASRPKINNNFVSQNGGINLSNLPKSSPTGLFSKKEKKRKDKEKDKEKEKPTSINTENTKIFLQAQQNLKNDQMKKDKDAKHDASQKIPIKEKISKSAQPDRLNHLRSKDKSITKNNIDIFLNQMTSIDTAKKPYGESSTLKKFLIFQKILSTNDKYILATFLSKSGWVFLAKWFKDWFNKWSENYSKSKIQFESVGKLVLDPNDNTKHEKPTIEYGFKLLKACDCLPLTKDHLIKKSGKDVAAIVKKIAESEKNGDFRVNILMLTERGGQHKISDRLMNFQKLASDVFTKWYMIAKPGGAGAATSDRHNSGSGNNADGHQTKNEQQPKMKLSVKQDNAMFLGMDRSAEKEKDREKRRKEKKKKRKREEINGQSSAKKDEKSEKSEKHDDQNSTDNSPHNDYKSPTRKGENSSETMLSPTIAPKRSRRNLDKQVSYTNSFPSPGQKSPRQMKMVSSNHETTVRDKEIKSNLANLKSPSLSNHSKSPNTPATGKRRKGVTWVDLEHPGMAIYEYHEFEHVPDERTNVYQDKMNKNKEALTLGDHSYEKEVDQSMMDESTFNFRIKWSLVKMSMKYWGFWGSEKKFLRKKNQKFSKKQFSDPTLPC